MGWTREDYSDTPYERATLQPGRHQTDAALMQYKSGGDENGVTGKLKDVTAWDPIRMSAKSSCGKAMTVAACGRRASAVGWRSSKARGRSRFADCPREGRRHHAAQARVLGALRNINLGTGL
jgi:hypothetical protein